jgi:hypothetical protein
MRAMTASSGLPQMRQSVSEARAFLPGTEDAQRRRNASLVDGVFHDVPVSSTDEHSHESFSPRDSLKLNDTFSGPARRQSRRQSWLRGVKSLFGATRSQQPASEGNESTTENKHSILRASVHRRNKSDASVTPSMSHRDFGLALDGAFDDQTSLSSFSSYQNKPLPLTPAQIASSLSSRSKKHSTTQSCSLLQAPSTASTSSTVASKVSGKQHFTSLTRDLLQSNQDMPFELHQVHDVDGRYRRQPKVGSVDDTPKS